MQETIFISGWVIFAVWSVVLLPSVVMLLVRRLERQTWELPDPNPFPTLSVIVPARDEGAKIETAKHDIEKTETTTGLNVVVRILDKVYETGRKYAEDFKQMMTIKFDKHLPKWNDTAIPDTI